MSATARALRASWAMGPAWLVGVIVMIGGGAPASRWGLQLGAGLLAAAGAIALAQAARQGFAPRWRTCWLLLAPLVVASSLVGDGYDGVRRWLDFGVVRLHPSAIVAPLLLLAWGHRLRSAPAQGVDGRRTLETALSVGGLSLVQLVHLAQPDAGQAVAVAAGIGVYALWPRTAASSMALRVGAAAVAIALAAAAAARSDVLAPSDFSEDILLRAAALSPLLAAAAGLSLALFVASPWLGSPRATWREPHAAALAAYALASLLAVLRGNYPIAVLGFGASPLLGSALALVAMRWVAAESEQEAGR